jgi:hypothetical protein
VRRLEARPQRLTQSLQYLTAVAGNGRSDQTATDDQHLNGLKQNDQVTSRDRETPQATRNNYDITNDDVHFDITLKTRRHLIFG